METTPDYTEYLSGRREMAAGNYSAAIRHFQKSIAHFPHFKTLELLGESMLATGDSLGSIVPLAAAVGLGSNEFRAAFLIAKAFAALGDYKTALKHVNRALEMRSDFKMARELRDQLLESIDKQGEEIRE